MAVKKDKVKTRATLAAKIAGKKTRARTFRRDLRGRFTFADAEVKGSTSAQVEAAREVLRKHSPASFRRQIRASARRQKGIKMRKRL